MAFNQIQFQHGMSIPEFLRSFGTEAQCAEAIKAARWPEGFRCPRCARLPLLESGADYCVDRHGNPRELVSVVANLLRRLRRFINIPSGFAEEGGQAAWRLINDGWSLSSPECLETGLTIKERQILMCLFDKAGEIVSREELVRALGEDVYNYDYSGLDALISRLRKKIAEQGLTFPLRTVRGKGFLLMPQSERNLLP